MKNMNWWTGVVEDRNDPEQLGRCRVRIFGYHSDNIDQLPTADLPWAIPLQSITSAAASGVGSAPVGIVTGSWVMGFFLDENQAQQPVIMGTIAGKPTETRNQSNRKKQESKKGNVRIATNGLPVYDQNNKAVEVNLSNTNIENTFAQLTDKDLKTLMDAIGKYLSNNDYAKEGSRGELGKYQFKIEHLISLGYVYLSLLVEETLDASYTDIDANWTGKDGITSKKAFKANKTSQENSMRLLLKGYHEDLLGLGKITSDDPYSLVAGLLFTSHVYDINTCDNLDRKDYSGKRAKEYFIVGAEALKGNSEILVQTVRSMSDISSYVEDEKEDYLTNAQLLQQKAFSDPQKKYPKYEYVGLTDVNKLAVGDTSHAYFKTKEKKLITDIQVAGTSRTWSEPQSAFYAKYPYNQVIETEAGHVIELDNTPLAERIHIFHRSGSYIEIDVNGTKVTKTVGDNYELIDNNNSIFVKGAHHLTVEGKTAIYVKDDAVIEVDGDLNVTGHGKTIVETATSLGLIGKDIVISATDSINIASNGPINIRGSNFNAQAIDNMSLKAGSDFAVQAKLIASIKGGTALLLDAIIVKTKMGATQVAGIAMKALSSPLVRSPDKTELIYLDRPTLDIDDTGSGEKIDSYDVVAALDPGQVSTLLTADTIRTKEQQFRSTTSPAITGNGNLSALRYESCEEFVKKTIFPFRFQLSPNYLLFQLMSSRDAPKEVTKFVYDNPRVIATEGEIVCNLVQLTNNCLEPIRKQFPGVIINSGLRAKDKPEKGYSDHAIGAAMDLAWKDKTTEWFINTARWCLVNIPYTQLFFELEMAVNRRTNSFTYIKAAWIHVALKLNPDGTIRKSGRGLNCGVMINDTPVILNQIPSWDQFEKFMRNSGK